jgi:SAM-dependent methyltransferase
MPIKDAVRLLYNRAFDMAYGIDTSESLLPRLGGPSILRDQVKYVPVDYLVLFYVLGGLDLSPEDTFFDIGCGLGRAVLMAARRPIRQAIGVEYDAQLAQRAQENGRRVRGRRAPIEIRNVDATVTDYSEGTIFCMYNPFGERTMLMTLEKIRQSLEIRPRAIRIAYVNPVFANLLDSQDWLRRRGERRFPGLGDNARAVYWGN